jgi:DnaJ family protein C protein 7
VAAAASGSASATASASASALSGEELAAQSPEWAAAEEQKERGNRRYAIKSWGEAHACYSRAVAELHRHPQRPGDGPAARAIRSRAASYLANSAAALMQLGKLPEALAECQAALKEDRRLGKALLRAAHVQLMLGDTEEARRFYAEAARAGARSESEAGTRSCSADETQAQRLNAELIMCRRASASTISGASASTQLRALVATLEGATGRAPHNAPLKALHAEALSAAGRASEARKLCAEQLAAPAAHRGHAAIWLYTLGRVLYDCSLLTEASEKLAEALQRPFPPAGARPLAKLAQKLDAERAEGNEAFKRQDWSAAVSAYTRALAVDPSHARFNALLYCNRGAAYGKQSQLQQAFADTSAAIALDRSYAKAYLRRAELRVRCGDRTRALEDFGTAQRLDMEGAVGQEAARRMHEMKREQARTASGAGAGAAGGAYAGAGGRPRSAHGGGAQSGARGGGGGAHAGSSGKSHYEVLGLEPNATADQLRKAYKKLCLKFHPDKNAAGNTPDKAAANRAFLEVQKAHDVLSDAAAKRAYDASLGSRSKGFGGFAARAGFGFGDGDDLFSQFYKGGAGGGAGSSSRRRW